MKEHNTAELEFFFTALKEEARTVIWQVGSNADPQTLVDSVIGDLEALAPKDNDTRTEEEIWKQVRERLLKAAYATRPYCVRCGNCCALGSATLESEDLELFNKDIVKPAHVITIRQGEPVTEEGQISPAKKEMIKIKEVPDTKTCVFYEKNGSACKIYDNRPKQCKLQECWNPGLSENQEKDWLDRKALLQETGQLWDVIQSHENKCSYEEFTRSMAKMGATKGETVEELLELLRYDHYVREFVQEHFKLEPDTLSFFFGRPLKDVLHLYGLRLNEQPDGCFLLTAAEG
jgi:Fe-S-cluster containining protein